MSINGLLLPQATHAQMDKSYYALANGGTLTNTTLVSPTILQGTPSEGALAVPARITVPGEGHADPEYVGSIALRPGGNLISPTGANGVVIRAGDPEVSGDSATIVEIGTNSEGPNLLFIAGALGVGQVYDEVYNQPVQLQPITLTNVSPTNIVDISNNGEIFRCVQAGVAQSAVEAIGATFAVPRTGFYQVAIEVKMSNSVAPTPVSIELAISVAPGGFDIASTLTFNVFENAVVNPYGLLDVSTQDFATAQIVVQGDGPVRQYSFMQLLEEGGNYRFTLRSSNPLINIGATGQIKAELIAMC